VSRQRPPKALQNMRICDTICQEKAVETTLHKTSGVKLLLYVSKQGVRFSLKNLFAYRWKWFLFLVGMLLGVGCVVGNGWSNPLAIQAHAAHSHAPSTRDGQVFTVNAILDIDDGACNTEHCSLREAINAANANAGSDTIAFDIPLNATREMTATHLLKGYDLDRAGRPEAAQTIFLETLLPPITDPVVIDGTTQPGFAGEPIIELNGDNIREAFFQPGEQVILNGLVITGGSSTVQGLVINRFQGNGIVLQSNNNLIQGNYIGTDLECLSQSRMGNAWSGIVIENASNNTIGGTEPAARNIISANLRHGILINGTAATGNVIQGNYIGLNKFGTGVDVERNPGLGNSVNGILIEGGSNNTIGGTEAGAANIISANTAGGIVISNREATGNLIQGNLIGTDTTGMMRLGNNGGGIIIRNAPGNTIGGTVEAARNVVVNNAGNGIFIEGSGATGTRIVGNYIGLNASGTDAHGNSGSGIIISESTENIIGGTEGLSRNVIAGNGGSGIRIDGSNATANSIQGNFIGTDATGSIGLGNQGSGILIHFSPHNTIGGTTTEARNVISANQAHGIMIDGSSASNNEIRGNYIGTDVKGTGDLGNAQDGVIIIRARNNIVGGSEPNAQNVIANNRRNGINLQGSTAEGNRVQGNAIGTDASGTARMGNANHGIILIGTPENLIGGMEEDAGNRIANNYLGGILVSGSIVQIRKNTIYSHGSGAALTLQGVEVVVAGNTIENNPLVFRLGTGKLNAYANNITNFVTALSREGGTFNGQHNWWGRASGPAPDGLEIDIWVQRLYAPVIEWAAGLGETTLGEASLNGGSGVSVIVSHPRNTFDSPYAEETDTQQLSSLTCSPFYDFFVVEGSGLWTVQVPVDDTPECATVLDKRQISWYAEPERCFEISSQECWELVPPEMIVAVEDRRVVISDLDTEELATSIIVAGDFTTPFLFQNQKGLLIVISGVLIVLTLAGIVWWRWSRSSRRSVSDTNVISE
jgi:CSLREA domain-containing protein